MHPPSNRGPPFGYHSEDHPPFKTVWPKHFQSFFFRHLCSIAGCLQDPDDIDNQLDKSITPRDRQAETVLPVEFLLDSEAFFGGVCPNLDWSEPLF